MLVTSGDNAGCGDGYRRRSTFPAMLAMAGIATSGVVVESFTVGSIAGDGVTR